LSRWFWRDLNKMSHRVKQSAKASHTGRDGAEDRRCDLRVNEMQTRSPTVAVASRIAQRVFCRTAPVVTLESLRAAALGGGNVAGDVVVTRVWLSPRRR